MLKSMRKSISCYFYHIFVSPGVAPGAIALSVAWIKKNSMLTNCLAACAYLTITVSAIERDIGENNGQKVMFDVEKLQWCGYPRLKKFRG